MSNGIKERDAVYERYKTVIKRLYKTFDKRSIDSLRRRKILKVVIGKFLDKLWGALQLYTKTYYSTTNDFINVKTGYKSFYTAKIIDYLERNYTKDRVE